MSETHYFLDLDAEYRTLSIHGSNGTSYERFENAKEFRVDRLTGSGVETETRDWVQRAAVNWGNEPFVTDANPGHGQQQPPNDPRVILVSTIIQISSPFWIIVDRLEPFQGALRDTGFFGQRILGQVSSLTPPCACVDKVLIIDIRLQPVILAKVNQH